MPPPMPCATGAAAGLVLDDVAGVDAQCGLIKNAAAGDGGVALDVGARHRGRTRPALSRPPPLPVAELPLTVQFLSAVVL